ncbi:MAG: response regulator, partial [Acidimicrobiia bacterium]|nr:response regulator [Acidimicrobiia bacterium]
STVDAVTFPDLRLLVVDDHDRRREVTAELLASWNVRVEAVPDGLTALQTMAASVRDSDPFSAIVADSEVPELSALFTQVALLPQDYPIALSSGLMRRSRPMPRGRVSAYLRRPIRRSQLVDFLNRCRMAPGVPGSVHGDVQPRERAGDLKGVRVLVVDDSAVNQRITFLMLDRLGCRVDTAANGLEAIEAVRAVPYDIVLMDVQMPTMDGLEATRQIRSAERSGEHIPIVAMTAFAMRGDRERCLEAGMDDYLAKPVSPEDLEVKMTKWAPKPDKSSAASA